jgi:2-C-methyl-D-erythritol 2,4-cyclodiphosphate synthase/2-C-methyl-D-erythritol 4-phosphate cytidylyltransferase
MGLGRPKQLLDLGGVPMLQRSVESCLRHPLVTDAVVALPVDLVASPPSYLVGTSKPVMVVEGGERRQDSVANAVARVRPSVDVVLVHDAARPLVSSEVIERTIRAAHAHGAALAAVPVADTLKRGHRDGTVAATVPRDAMFLAQTPQAFRPDVLRAALASGVDATDEATLAERAGFPVHLVEGDPANVKVTTASDLAMAERMVSGRARGGVRVGTGYDLHRLVVGRPLVLGGVSIPYERGLLGHSDADIVCHAVTDAVLGAASLGDIGRHFPDTDPQWKGADSLRLLGAAARLVRDAGWSVGNVDVAVIAERPKLLPYVAQMRINLAAALACHVDQVSVKGKTNEGVDATGAGDAMAAHAVALLER